MAKKKVKQEAPGRGNIINELNELKSALKSATPSNFPTLKALVDKLLSENLSPSVKRIVENLSKAVFEKEQQIHAAHAVEERRAEEEKKAAQALKEEVDEKIAAEIVEANRKNHELEIIHREKEILLLKNDFINFSAKFKAELDKRDRLHERLLNGNPPLTLHEKALITNDRSSPHVSMEQWKDHDESTAYIQNKMDKTFKLRDHSLKSIKHHKSKMKLNQSIIDHPDTPKERKAKLQEENKESVAKLVEHENNVKSTDFIEENRKKELAEIIKIYENGDHTRAKTSTISHFETYKTYYQNNLNSMHDKDTAIFFKNILKDDLIIGTNASNFGERSQSNASNSNLIIEIHKKSIDYADNIKKHLNDSIVDQNSLKPSLKHASSNIRKRSQTIDI